MPSKFGGIAVQPSQSKFGGIAVDEEELQQEGQSLGGMALGAANLGASAAVGMGKSAIEGLTGLGGIITGQTAGEASETGKATADLIPDMPIGEEGQQLISTISEKFQASPQLVKDIFNAVSTLGPSIGESAFQATGSPLAASLAGALPGALEGAAGIKAARALPDITGGVTEAVAAPTTAVADVFTRQSPAKQKIAKMLSEGGTDKQGAGFRLAKGLDLKGRAKVVENTLEKEALKQGFDPGVIASLKGLKTVDKVKLVKMSHIMEKAKNNRRYSVENRPSNVLGDSLMDRVRIIQGANKAAGRRLDSVSNSLKGEFNVDFSPAVDQFASDLSDMGISLGRGENGVIKANFKGSDIEDLAGPESVINRMVKRMGQKKPVDAYELHRMKKFIDEQVTYGKNAEGLAGKAEKVLKDFRRNIDGVLDSNFPEYDRINTAYSETIGALDELQAVAGKKMNLTGPNADKATGTLMRRLMSNAQSRITLLDSVNNIQGVAKKYEGFKGKIDPRAIEGPKGKSKIDDDLMSQVLFADELDAQFGTVARTSLQGELEKNVRRGARAATSKAGLTEMVIEAGAKKIDEFKDINDDAAFKAIIDLLKE